MLKWLKKLFTPMKEKTPCQRATALAIKDLKGKYPLRIGHGWLDKTCKEPHRWLEYLDIDKIWKVYDKAIWYASNRAWTAQELKYVVKYYEEMK